MKVFWDTNLFIYLIEQDPVWQPKVLSLYRRQQLVQEQVITSTLTLGELMTQPLRLGQSHLALQYVDLLTHGTVGLIAFDASAAEHYAAIRAKTGLRQPDSIQFACAVAGGAQRFITNDRRLWGVQISDSLIVEGLM